MSSVQFPQQTSSRDRRGSDHPLTHHEIMRLVSPFSRRGYRVDLEASDRARRRLCFHPVEVAAAAGAHPVLRSTLMLELPGRGPNRLTRSLTTEDGLAATVVAEGTDPAALLEQVERLETTRQLRTVDGTLLALNYRLSSQDSALFGGSGAAPVACAPRLVSGESRVGPITLKVTEGARQAPFEVELSASEGRRLDITEDFLAVIDWCWRPLRVASDGVWRGTLKAPAREPRRTAALEAALCAGVAHLTATLAGPPSAFHARHRRARWRVAYQRVLPLLSGTALLAGLVGLVLVLPKTQMVHVIMLHVPPLLMILFFTQTEIPTLEFPPLPRELTYERWYPAMGDRVPSSDDAAVAGASG